MRSSAIAVLLSISIGCAAPRAQAPQPHARPAPPQPSRTPDARAHELVVLDGIAPWYADPCFGALMWGVVDAPVAGQKLDELLAANPDPSKKSEFRESLCIERVVVARLARLVRLRELDIRAELRSPHPVVRSITTRYVAVTHAAAWAPTVRELIDDPHPDVRREAYGAIVDLLDRGAIPRLRAIAARSSDATSAEQACVALWQLGDNTACGGSKLPLPQNVIGGFGPPRDLCAEAQAQLTSGARDQQIKGLLYFVNDAFDPVHEPFDTFLRAVVNRTASQRCLAPMAAIAAMERSNDRKLRSLAAAFFLWDAHRPLATTIRTRSER
ncbi:MAG: HEAT repeat domain-containing protein [Kofleriaceae bacterium]